MKRILIILLLALSFNAQAVITDYDFIIGNYYYKITSDNPKEVALVRNFDACIHYRGNIVIPDSVLYNNSYYKVTAIEYYVFLNATINSIVFPKELRYIGERAFEGATFGTNSATLSLPKSLTAIHSYAFSECSGIEKISIPASVSIIEQNAFAGIQTLKAIEVDASNQYFSSYNKALYNKDKSTIICCPINKLTYTLHENTTTIAEEAFGQCMINALTIPSTVTAIHSRAFANCIRLTSMHIPASVSYMGGGLFKGCHNLKSLSIDSLNQYYKVVDTVVYSINMDTLISHHLASGNVEVRSGVKVVAEDAFSLCKARNVELPEGLIEIKDRAFVDVLTLRSVTFPQTLKKIGMYSFLYCEQLETIDIPNSVTLLGNCAFEGCYSLHTVRMSDSIKVIPTMLFYACLSLRTYTGGNSVERINFNAFGSTDLSNKKIVFPPKIRYIEEKAFNECVNIQAKFTGVVDTLEEDIFGSLSSLVLKNTVPPYAPKAIAGSISQIIIPCGATEAYMADLNWSSYSYTEDCDGVEENPMSAVKVTAGYRSVEVLNAEGYSVAIYDVMGRCIVNEPANGLTHRHYSVPAAGVYVVRVNDRGYKVVVR
ncbi:MAG: leucine-rich repeat domain-containing protein [Bacteroidales bacterium]|nr:leucine-rich repeat domain-containing protein [Bacteroidales bacterium]